MAENMRSMLTLRVMIMIAIIIALSVTVYWNAFIISDPIDRMRSSYYPTVTFISAHNNTQIAYAYATQTAVATTTAALRPGIDAKVITNAEWQPYIEEFAREFEGVEMVLVPMGCFTMGLTEKQVDYLLSFTPVYSRNFFLAEMPTTKVCLEKLFWIDRYEVSNQQFADFEGEAEYESMVTTANFPRDRISWDEANAFCEKRGARLPTESEWEYAARGPDARIFPWGDDFVEGVTAVEKQQGVMPDAIGSDPLDVSWVGAYDMGGNASEWVYSSFGEYPYKSEEAMMETRSIRAYRGTTDRRATARLYVYLPSDWLFMLGFRCVRAFE